MQYEKYPIKKDEKNNIWIDIKYKNYFEAPVTKNTKIGKVIIGINTTEIMNIDIINKEQIEKKEIRDYFTEILSKIPTGKVLFE